MTSGGAARGLWIIMFVIAGFILGVIVGGTVGYSIGTSPESNESSAAPTTRKAPVFITTETPAPVAPKPFDFVVDIAVTEQQCFGGAGCNYELAINPRYVGITGLTTGKYKVVYEIVGGDDPQQGNFTLDGTNIRWDQDKRIQGSSGAVFVANVLQVLPAY